MIAKTRVSSAYLYGRHSSYKQDLTQEVQHDLCLRYYEDNLRKHGVVLAPPGWFYDEAVSSVNYMGEREVGRIVLASIQPGDHLVIAKMSRTFRSVRDGANTIAMLEARGVALHVVDLPVDGSRASGRLVRNVTMSMDQYYREIAVEAQYEVMNYRKSAGLPYSRGTPIGWEAVGRKPHRVWRVDMQERALADAMAVLHAKGWAMSRIAYWASHQTEYPNKRKLDNRDAVWWALAAREHDYPRITGYKTLRTMIAKGEI